MRIIFVLLLAGLLTACEEPTVRFEAFALPRPVNLARVLGPAPVLVGPQDTLALHLRFEPATGFTEFRVQTDSTEESWFRARAFRYRGLYYLVEEGDAGYGVHAVRIGRGQVQGLGTGYRQMRALSKAAWQGHWPSLLVAGDSMRLRFDRRQLREFYREQVEGSVRYQLAAVPAADSQKMTTNTPAPTPHLYPNPASTTVTVAVGSAGARQVQLFTAHGQLLRTYPVSTPQLTLPVAVLPSGAYLVRVHQMGQGRPTMLRLQVTH